MALLCSIPLYTLVNWINYDAIFLPECLQMQMRMTANYAVAVFHLRLAILWPWSLPFLFFYFYSLSFSANRNEIWRNSKWNWFELPEITRNVQFQKENNIAFNCLQHLRRSDYAMIWYYEWNYWKIIFKIQGRKLLRSR